MDKDIQVVGLRIGRETFGIPIGMVREIVRVPDITSVPNAPDYIEGVINLRGRLVILLDLSRILQRGELRRLDEVAKTEVAKNEVAEIVETVPAGANARKR